MSAQQGSGTCKGIRIRSGPWVRQNPRSHLCRPRSKDFEKRQVVRLLVGWLARLPARLLARSFACLLDCLLDSSIARSFVCSLTCVFDCSRACLPACLLACSFACQRNLLQKQWLHFAQSKTTIPVHGPQTKYLLCQRLLERGVL